MVEEEAQIDSLSHRDYSLLQGAREQATNNIKQFNNYCICSYLELEIYIFLHVSPTSEVALYLVVEVIAQPFVGVIES